MNGTSIKINWTRTIPPVCTEKYERHRSSASVPGRGRHPDGRGLDDVRPDRSGALGPPVRPGRPARRGVAATGLGGRHPGGLGAAAAVAVPAPDVAGRDRAWRRHGRGDDAVHGVGGPAAAWHRERGGVPWAAGRGRRAQPGRPDAAVARLCRGRRGAADPALAGRRGPGRGRLRARRGRLLGVLHPAHPGGRGRAGGPAGAGGLAAGGRGGGHAGGGPGRHPDPDPAAAGGGSGPGSAAAGGAVQPGDVRAATAEHGRLRHPDVAGAGDRPDRRPAAAAPAARGLVAGRHGLRRRRGSRRRADRRPARQARRPARISPRQT